MKVGEEMFNDLEDLNVNLGKVTKNDFKESSSITVIRNQMETSKRIKVRTQEADKIPNLDGKLMILDNNSKERISVEVQIKTLPKEYNETSPYKYDCDTKVFNVVLHKVTFNPVVLLMVDINNNKIYWKHITDEYAKSLNIGTQETKRINFSDDDLYDETKFLNELISQAKTLTLLLNKDDKATITTNINESSPFYSEMQTEIDRINNLFDNDLKVIKETLFPNIWKFGIAYTKDDTETMFGIYAIKKGKNGTLVKNFDINEKYMTAQFSKSSIDISLKDSTNHFLENVLTNFYRTDILFSKYLPNKVLFEITYNFLDTLSHLIKEYRNKNKQSYYYKNEENADNVIQYMNGLGLFYYELFYGKFKDKQSQFKTAILNVYNAYQGFLTLNLLLQPNEEEYQLLIECLSNNKKIPQPIPLYGSQINLSLVNFALQILKQRGITKIKRVYPIINNQSDYNQQLYNNIDTLFKNIVTCYNSTYKNLFDKNEKYKLVDEYTIIYDIQNQYNYCYFIKDNNKLKITYINENYNINHDKYYKNKDYKANGGGFYLNAISFAKNPLFNYIKMMIVIGIANELGISKKVLSNFNTDNTMLPLIRNMVSD